MSKPTITAFYGPKQLGDSAINTIASAIDNHTDLTVSNDDLGGDPAFGVVKYGMVYYSLAPGLPFRMRGGQEGQKFIFSKDIKSIVYGNQEVKDQFVYDNMYNALMNNKAYPVSNDSMGGDPAPRTVKVATVMYINGTGPPIEISAVEGQSLVW